MSIIKKNKKKSNSALQEIRPIRDASFINEAKIKIIDFLNATNYHHESIHNIFKNMSTSELKNIFEHFLRQLCPTYRLNESNVGWEQTILNFFATFNYKSNFTVAHMKSPTLVSSLKFVVAALDYMRRLIMANMKINPQAFFPLIENLDVSTEFIVTTIVQMKSLAGNGQYDNISNAFKQMRINLQKLAGVMTEDERTEKDNRLMNIEAVLNSNMEILVKKEELHDYNVKLQSESVENSHLLREMKIVTNNLVAEIDEMVKHNNLLLEEKSVLKLEVERFVSLGYDDTLSQLNEQKVILNTAQENCAKWKSKEEELKRRKIKIESEIESMKLHARTELIGVHCLSSDDFNKILSNINIYDLMNYQTNIRPIFHALISNIESEARVRAREINERKIACEAQDAEYLTLKRETENLKAKEAKYEMLAEKIISDTERVTNEYHDEQRELDELKQTLEDMRAEASVLEAKNIELKATLLREQQETADAKAFFEADIGLRKCFAEERVRDSLSGYTLHASIMALRRETLKRDHEYVEELKAETVELEKNLTGYWEEEFKRLRTEHT